MAENGNAEETSAGAGRILGTNEAQRAVDSLTSAVKKLATDLNGVAPTLRGIANGRGGFSYTAPAGQAPNGGYAPRHAPTQPPASGWSYKGQALGLGATVAAVGLYGKNHFENNLLMQSSAYQTTMAIGGDWRNLAKGTAAGNNTMSSRADAFGARDLYEGRFSAGSRSDEQFRSIISTGYLDPSISNTAAVNAANTLTSARSTMGLRGMGINTYSGPGQKKEPRQIARDILSRVNGYAIKTQEQMNAALSQNGGISVTLDNWMANGIISADQEDVIRAEIVGILRAQVSGMSFSDYNRNMNNQQTSASARSALNKIGIGGSSVQDLRDLEGKSATRETEFLGAFDNGLEAATDALGLFKDAITGFLTVTGIGSVLAYAGTAGAMLGGAAGGAMPFMAGAAGARGAVSGIVGAGGRSGGGALGGVRGRMAETFSGRNLARVGAGAGVGVAGGMAGGLVSDGNGGARDYAGSALSWGASGAGLGMMFGPVGALVGGGIGALVGLGVEALDDDATGGTGGSEQDKYGTKAGGKVSRGKMSFVKPVGGKVTSPYGMRFHPVKKVRKMHTGIDLAAGQGTPVKAAASGKVIEARYQGDWGNKVLIDHGGGVHTMYAHNSRFKARRGQQVRQGEVIAYAGATGSATGPHVHFEVHINGQHTDPAPYLNGASMAVSGDLTTGTNTADQGGPSRTGVGESTSAASSVSSGASSSTSEAANIAAALGGLASVSAGGTIRSDESIGDVSGSVGSGDQDSGSSVGVGSAPANPSGNVALGKRMAGARGWTGKEWDALYQLWKGESSWNHKAANPTSSARGIPQAMMSIHFGKDWKNNSRAANYLNNPGVQIDWGLDYISDTYGTPSKAYGKWKARSPHWYDKGAWEIPADVDARVHKGEMIVPERTADTIRDALRQEAAHGVGSTLKGSGKGVELTFMPGSIVVRVNGAMGAAAANNAGKQIVDAIMADDRLTKIAQGG